jgi:CheY-like chemotaxis protein
MTENNNFSLSSDNLKDIQVLVAEDEESSFRYIEKMLHEVGITVLRAVNGQEAIDITNSNENIQLIIMDIKMPVKNGIEATREIKKLKPLLPIIATTAFMMPGDRQIYQEAGCNDYISKPLKQKELFLMIEKYVL